jgi:hypothetical protein
MQRRRTERPWTNTVLPIVTVMIASVIGHRLRKWRTYCEDRARNCEMNARLCRMQGGDEPFAKNFEAMARRYRTAAMFPWISVEPDPAGPK